MSFAKQLFPPLAPASPSTYGPRVTSRDFPILGLRNVCRSEYIPFPLFSTKYLQCFPHSVANEPWALLGHLIVMVMSKYTDVQDFWDLKIRWRRRQRERRKNNTFNNQNDNFARASRFFVHFFAVTARLRRENAKFHVVQRKDVHKRRQNFLPLSELGDGS